MIKKEIKTTQAPQAIGPYSQAVQVGEMLYISGQLPLNPLSGELEHQEIVEQTKQALKNLDAVLKAADSTLENVVKTTVLLKNMDDFSKMNQVYSHYFTGICPARAAYQVAALPKGALIEIEAIAFKNIKGEV
ncbi:MAG: RidA family protein [Vagococcus sp.]|jgi:2-iminobutanoate/2-iminopropanoate deaminase|nr:RidA family protein [Vagococcus sp.]